jgi:hypothetical protein
MFKECHGNDVRFQENEIGNVRSQIVRECDEEI